MRSFGNRRLQQNLTSPILLLLRWLLTLLLVCVSITIIINQSNQECKLIPLMY